MNKSGDQNHLTWGRRALRACGLATSLAVAAAMFVAVPAFAANTNTAACNSTDATAVSGITYTVNNAPVTDLNGLKKGDHVVVHFTTTGECNVVSFASYLDSLAIPTSANPDLSNQVLFSSDTSGSGGFPGGTHTLAIDIPCQYQADFVIGGVITKFTATDIYHGPPNRLIDTGFGSSPCTSPTPTPTESIQSTVTPSATSNVHGVSTSGAVAAAAVTNPNTGNGSEAFAGFVALLMVLTGIAVLAEVRRRRVSS